MLTHCKHHQGGSESSRMGGSTASAVLSRPCANGLSPLTLHLKPNARFYLRQRRRSQKLAPRLLQDPTWRSVGAGTMTENID